MSSYCLWSQWEFQTLLLVLVDLDVKRRLTRGAERCPKIFKEVALELARHGVQKSEKQALQKYRNLKTAYKHFVQRKENGFPVNYLPLQELQEKVFGSYSELCTRGRLREDSLDSSALRSPSGQESGLDPVVMAGLLSGRSSLSTSATTPSSTPQTHTAGQRDQAMTDADGDQEFSLPLAVQLEVTSPTGNANGLWDTGSGTKPVDSLTGLTRSSKSQQHHSLSQLESAAANVGGLVLRVDVSGTLASALSVMRRQQQLLDVTLVCDGRSVRAHRVLLAAHSPLFSRLLMDHPSKHPIIILRDTPYTDMKLLLELLYNGQVAVKERQLLSVTQSARDLQLPAVLAMLQSTLCGVANNAVRDVEEGSAAAGSNGAGDEEGGERAEHGLNNGECAPSRDGANSAGDDSGAVSPDDTAVATDNGRADSEDDEDVDDEEDEDEEDDDDDGSDGLTIDTQLDQCSAPAGTPGTGTANFDAAPADMHYSSAQSVGFEFDSSNAILP